jgi:uncharacterized protein YkwD
MHADLVLLGGAVQGRKLDLRWPLVLSVFALAGVMVVFFSRGSGEAPSHAQAVAPPAPISQTLGSREFPAAPPVTLEQSLQAADLLVKAGKLAPPPTLEQSLQAADLLVRAGVIAPPPPPLIDILHAAALLADAQAADAPPASASVPPPPISQAASPPPNAAVVAAAAGNGGYYDAAFTAQVFSLVNQRRQSTGLRALTLEPRLANSAAAYTKVLADNHWFSHTGPDGSTLVTRDQAAGFPFTVQLGEVLAWGSNGWTPAEIVQAWIDSPAHRDQLLSPVYTRAGAGCYFTNEPTPMVRCAMEFAAG